MQMNLQVLSIGAIESGTSQATRRPWHRRTFQCFDLDDQIVGSITLYAPEDELKAYTQNGKYVATVTKSQGDGGTFEFRITALQLMTAPQKAAA
ncbi:MAG: hypothetical protein ACT6RZ_11540 [Methylophilus sp.]|uniref:hypothetical protein n=1 Tax=Methylophilus sp. TaxID=29541 RepID=UPI0040362FDD